MITVTKPFLPPIEMYQKYVKDIWDRNWLTNSGPIENKLEQGLKEFLNLDHAVFVSNGTIAIQLGIKALNLTGEIITTPFSYVATTSTIVWENCTPVFVDIDKESFNINPELIEASVTPKTSAIMATHVFGNPCEIKKIEKIAKAHNLKVIYDAAHGFGVNYNGKSVYSYGDLSTASFHATKLYHTVEGGLVVTQNAEVLQRVSRMKSFGHKTPTSFDEVGINGKNSEFHAAMGLCNLNFIDEILERRSVLSKYYSERLKGQPIVFQKINPNCDYNYAYYPILLDSEETLLRVMKKMAHHKIYPRRYFYPSLNTLHYVKDSSCIISEDIAPRVLCLPLYHQLKHDEQDLICQVLKDCLNN